MVKANDTARVDVYERITNAIIAQLEAGTCPWIGGAPARRPLRHNGVHYSGINTIILWMAAVECGYQSSFWMTYKQASELGAHRTRACPVRVPLRLANKSSSGRIPSAHR
ncbi:DUF1738 domain-containing protein [Agrobacterium vitis]|uniref:DUF1738 domain-containing protein n=1 Tax=Agrobacterium vitis TaxID=373 RepID=A0A7K1RFP8_AGRVI|nr:DUF1738 domain-containing protein [Agrobacterium vitis]